MPQRNSTADRFIRYLQQELGQSVAVPDSVTDVLRSTRFPGLEGGGKAPELPDPNVGAFDASMLPDMGNLGGGTNQGPSMPARGEGGPPRGRSLLPDEDY